jgi:ABC-2 type transport system ATP-binding protein
VPPPDEQADAAIAVEGLRREYGSQVALEGATFAVRRGEVFGFLGPNGAGTTTTLRILAGLLRPSGGSARVDGLAAGPDRADAKARVGYAPEEPAYPRTLRARPLLVRYAAFHGLTGEAAEARATELLDLVGLGEAREKKLGAFSHGMRKRFSLAQALLHDPPVLLLDEPSAGMDPAAQAWFRAFVRALAGQGKAVLLSTHLLHEAGQVCDRVAVVHRGRVVAVDAPQALAGRAAGRVAVRIEALRAEDAEDALRALPGVRALTRSGDEFRIDADAREVAAEAVAVLVQRGARVLAVESAAPSLEDVFLQLTGATA